MTVLCPKCNYSFSSPEPKFQKQKRPSNVSVSRTTDGLVMTSHFDKWMKLGLMPLASISVFSVLAFLDAAIKGKLTLRDLKMIPGTLVLVAFFLFLSRIEPKVVLSALRLVATEYRGFKGVCLPMPEILAFYAAKGHSGGSLYAELKNGERKLLARFYYHRDAAYFAQELQLELQKSASFISS